MWLQRISSILGHGLRSRRLFPKNHETFNMLAVLPVIKYNPQRTYKNFGHKDDPPEHPMKKVYLLAFIGILVYQFVDWEK